MTLDRKWADVSTAVFLLLAQLYMFWETFSFTASTVRGYPGAAFFPRLVLALTVTLTLLWMAKLLLARRVAPEAAEPIVFEIPDIVVVAVAAIFFVLGLRYIGFELTLTIIAFGLLLPRLGSWWQAALSAVATTAVCYAIFVAALGVSLPMLFLPEYVTF